jgi:hypothetical protein
MIAEALTAYATTCTRAFEARVQAIGASEIGQCARKTFYLKHEGTEFGAARDPEYKESWGPATRGSVYEKHFWEPALRARYGARLLFAGDEQESFALSFLSGTPDGLLVACEPDVLAPLGVADIGGDGSLLVECKTVDPRTKLAEPRLAHAYQVQVGLGLIRALTMHRPEYGLLSYTDASDWSVTREFAIARDPAVFETAQRRAQRILTARSAQALAPEGRIAGGRECKFCPFMGVCP